MRRMSKFLFIGFGAFVGANARYLMQNWAATRWGTAFPLGTLLVNVVGSFILAFFMTVATQRVAISSNWRLFVGVGLLGGYTTFSSFAFETLALMGSDQWLSAAFYFGGNVMVGLLAAFAGMMLARAI